MRDPKTEKNAVIMERIEIIYGDLYDIPSRYINNETLTILRAGAPETEPIVLAVWDCDDEEKEVLAYRVAKEVCEGLNYRLSPRKITSNCYILEEVM
jgi:hypothetical protein